MSSIAISIFSEFSPLISNSPSEIHKLKSPIESTSDILLSRNIARLPTIPIFDTRLFSNSKLELSRIKIAVVYCGCMIVEFFITTLLLPPQTTGYRFSTSAGLPSIYESIISNFDCLELIPLPV